MDRQAGDKPKQQPAALRVGASGPNLACRGVACPQNTSYPALRSLLHKAVCHVNYF